MRGSGGKAPMGVRGPPAGGVGGYPPRGTGGEAPVGELASPPRRAAPLTLYGRGCDPIAEDLSDKGDAVLHARVQSMRAEVTDYITGHFWLKPLVFLVFFAVWRA